VDLVAVGRVSPRVTAESHVNRIHSEPTPSSSSSETSFIDFDTLLTDNLRESPWENLASQPLTFTCLKKPQPTPPPERKGAGVDTNY